MPATGAPSDDTVMKVEVDSITNSQCSRSTAQSQAGRTDAGAFGNSVNFPAELCGYCVSTSSAGSSSQIGQRGTDTPRYPRLQPVHTCQYNGE
ncbi:MAG: hypothetical protein RLZZ450_7765 [Pseudomonadota bacterium]